MRKRARTARRLFQMGEDERARRVLWGGERKLSYKGRGEGTALPDRPRALSYHGRRRSGGPPDLPRALGLAMALGTVVVLAGFGAVAFNMWPDLKARFEPRVVSRVTPGGSPELVVQRDRSGHYVVPGTVNGVEVEFMLDTGATDVAIPPALAERLNLRRGPEVEIRTASDIIPGYLVTLDEVSIGPLTLTRVRVRVRVRGSVSERSVADEVLLGMSFLRHFELSQRGRSLTLRAPASP